mmetsp:Transcript_13686/g.16586  ORF Transcript_13686/g.16586 Transcript_13686/m.16586 type:complete len:309 (+) Transcript_13686:109-1035(+)
MTDQNSLDKGIPQVFVGTMEDLNPDGPGVYQTTLNNLKSGIRYIDCAEAYESLSEVARAIKDSGVDRKELFVCSKIKGLPLGNYKAVEKRVQEHLSNLGLTYLDLLLIHWPGPDDCDFSSSVDEFSAKATWEYFDQNIDESWEIMKSLQEGGQTRRIGVSNFYQKHLERLQGKPFANEIFIDATHGETQLVEFMQEKGIHVLAYRPLVFLSAIELAGSMGSTTMSQIQELADKNDVVNAQQLVLSWLLARGCSVIVKSANSEHIQSNLKACEIAKTIDIPSLKDLGNADDLVAMCGGTDEYSAIFRSH